MGPLRAVPRAWEMAERVGFEPTMHHRRIPVFETGAFNRSAISPRLSQHSWRDGAFQGRKLPAQGIGARVTGVGDAVGWTNSRLRREHGE